ncbi:MAG: carboxypeptidase regulatory-like domain-containing protein [Gemmatimonadaceae bacterium]
MRRRLREHFRHDVGNFSHVKEAGTMDLQLVSRRLLTLALIGVAGVVTRAYAQTGTAGLRGHVYGTQSEPVSEVQVMLRNPASGFARGALTNADGFYNIAAVPPGTYGVRVQRIGFTPQDRTVRLQVGENATVDFTISTATVQLATVAVTATTAPTVDIRSTEVATNITTQQIQDLPQGNRNFLDFATLAPGVQPRQAGISSGGASVSNSNLFIDGASYKSDVLPGGVAGQDPSLRNNLSGIGPVTGNPFPQSAVQEFRVITENYKAEYQKASGAVITAATKSGTNTTHGDLFYQGQTDGFIARNEFQSLKKLAVPSYKRSQFGGSIGGPIIRDRAHYFLSYEGNYQNHDERVSFTRPTTVPPGITLPDSIFAGGGLFNQPLRSNLFFGKATYQLSESQDLVVTGNLRRETQHRDFGGSTAASVQTTVNNNVSDLLLRHTWASQPYTNEAQINYNRFQWLNDPTNPDQSRLIYRLPGLGVPDVIRGGNIGFQNFIQDRVSLKDQLTWTLANHVVKGGGNVDFLRYNVNKQLEQSPTFFFATDAPGQLSSPYFAFLQVGDPKLKTSNKQFGVFLQDDWSATPRLTVNLGLRWDYETNWLNNTFVTPQWVRDSVAKYVQAFNFFKESDYISTGSSRPNFYKAFQPRVGFSYDVSGDNRLVVFGGGGMFYDRINYNVLLDEIYKAQRPQYRFNFVPPDSTPRPGQTRFDPRFFQRDALLAATGTAGFPDVFLINNNTNPPYTVQYSLGGRKAFGNYNFSMTGTLVNGYNYFKWIWGNRDPATGNLHFGEHGIGGLVISTDEGRSWYKGLLFQLSRPLSGESRWGGDLSYTLSKTETNHWQDVEDPFAFDYWPGNKSYGFNRMPSRFDERHRVVFNAITRLPWEVRFSTITTLGSGNPYTLSTFCTQPVPNPPQNPNQTFCATQPPVPVGGISYFQANPAGLGPRSEQPASKWFGPFGKWAYRNVDVRLQKDFSIGSQTLGASLDVLNVFNFTNYDFSNSFVYNVRSPSTAPRHPTGEFDLYGSRRIQLGGRYAF